jgi:hypothetical protein
MMASERGNAGPCGRHVEHGFCQFAMQSNTTNMFSRLCMQQEMHGVNHRIRAPQRYDPVADTIKGDTYERFV